MPLIDFGLTGQSRRELEEFRRTGTQGYTASRARQAAGQAAGQAASITSNPALAARTAARTVGDASTRGAEAEAMAANQRNVAAEQILEQRRNAANAFGQRVLGGLVSAGGALLGGVPGLITSMAGQPSPATQPSAPGAAPPQGPLGLPGGGGQPAPTLPAQGSSLPPMALPSNPYARPAPPIAGAGVAPTDASVASLESLAAQPAPTLMPPWLSTRDPGDQRLPSLTGMPDAPPTRLTMPGTAAPSPYQSPPVSVAGQARPMPDLVGASGAGSTIGGGVNVLTDLLRRGGTPFDDLLRSGQGLSPFSLLGF